MHFTNRLTRSLLLAPCLLLAAAQAHGHPPRAPRVPRASDYRPRLSPTSLNRLLNHTRAQCEGSSCSWARSIGTAVVQRLRNDTTLPQPAKVLALSHLRQLAREGKGGTGQGHAWTLDGSATPDNYLTLTRRDEKSVKTISIVPDGYRMKPGLRIHKSTRLQPRVYDERSFAIYGTGPWDLWTSHSKTDGLEILQRHSSQQLRLDPRGALQR